VQLNGGTLLADGPQATITASLLYASPSASTYQGSLAGSGNWLTLDNPAALLILSGSSNSYTGGTYVEAGTLEITSAGGLPSGSALSVGADASQLFGTAMQAAPAGDMQAVPEPGTLALLITGAALLAMFRKRR
jgi:autotransporter-associated beta strand protein